MCVCVEDKTEEAWVMEELGSSGIPDICSNIMVHLIREINGKNPCLRQDMNMHRVMAWKGSHQTLFNEHEYRIDQETLSLCALCTALITAPLLLQRSTGCRWTTTMAVP